MSFNNFLQLTKKFVEVYIFPDTSVYVYMIIYDI